MDPGLNPDLEEPSCKTTGKRLIDSGYLKDSKDVCLI